MSRHPSNHAPVYAITGVSGSGKSTLAAALAELLNYRYLDADDLHSREAREQMAQGIPLVDEQREPWIDKIKSKLLELNAQASTPVVLAYSGLRARHRQQLQNAYTALRFIQLNIEAKEVQKRCLERRGHFMPASLVQSQFDALEPFAPTERVLTLNGAHTINENLSTIIKHFQLSRAN